MRHAQGLVVMAFLGYKPQKKKKKMLPLPTLIYSYRCKLVSESEHLARLTTAHLHGCDGGICIASDHSCLRWHSLLMDSWQQRSEAILPVTELKLLLTDMFRFMKEGDKWNAGKDQLWIVCVCLLSVHFYVCVKSQRINMRTLGYLQIIFG